MKNYGNRKLTRILLGFIMIAGLSMFMVLPVRASGDEANTVKTESWAELAAVLGNLGESEDNLAIELTKNIEWDVSSGSLVSLVIPENTNVILDLNGKTITGNPGSYNASPIIKVYGSLTLKDSVGGGKITGNYNSATGGGVYVFEDGTFEMTGGEISGNTAGDGGGVYVGVNATFTMSGGTISGNIAEYGGGVYVYEDATFTMSGDTISGNTAGAGGGGVFVTFGTIKMTGGVISNNTAEYGGGLDVRAGTFEMFGGVIGGENNGNTADYGGGVYVKGFNYDGESYVAEFTMNGGEISGNTAGKEAVLNDPNSSALGGYGGGVYVGEYAKFTMQSGKISDNKAIHGLDYNNDEAGWGSGVFVYLDGTFKMEGGIISSNTAQYGSGVCVYTGTFKMTDGEISGNTAEYGGGVYLLSYDDCVAVFEMNGGEISGNTAGEEAVDSNSTDVPGSGGGVYVGEYSKFTMGGDSKISKNEAIYVYNHYGDVVGAGGGVFVERKGTFTMNEGEISDNTAEYGGGVYVLGYNGDVATFTMNGGKIIGNIAGKEADQNDPNSTDVPGSGGGVYVGEYAEFAMSGDSTIGGNKAIYIDGSDSEGFGGGVYVYLDGTFTMDSGKISGNAAECGGGVHLVSYDDDRAAAFEMNGGEISGNTAVSNGGGVYFFEGDFSISGSPVIEDNVAGTGNDAKENNVYLAKEQKTITIIGMLDDAAWIGVTTKTVPTKDAPVTFTNGFYANNELMGTEENFFDDREIYATTLKVFSDDKKELVLSVPYTEIYTVTYDANGADANYSKVPTDENEYVPGDEATVKAPDPDMLKKNGYIVVGWYTLTKNNGEDIKTYYKAGETLVITGNTTLYADWRTYATFTGEPTMAQNLVYTGEARKLVTADPSVTGGTMMYSIENTPYSYADGAVNKWYTREDFKQTNANEVGYPVYFFVKGDDDHVDSDVYGGPGDGSAGTKIFVVAIAKADNAPNLPNAQMTVAYGCDKVSSVTLPANWAWDTDDAKKALTVGTAVSATALYQGSDKANYAKVSVTVSITRSKCTHDGAETEIKDYKPATCTEDGYTGDVYCKVCGELKESGTVKTALGHDYGTPVTPKYEWSKDGKSCKASVSCKRDGCKHVESEDGVITSKTKTPPTTANKGVTTYTATFKNKLFTSQDFDVEDIDKLIPTEPEQTNPSGTEQTNPSGTVQTNPSGTEQTNPSGTVQTNPSGTDVPSPADTDPETDPKLDPKPVVTENPDGTSTVTEVKKDEDGSTVKTAITTDPDGKLVEKVTETTEKNPDGKVTVNTTTEKPDGTQTVNEVITNSRGKVVETVNKEISIDEDKNVTEKSVTEKSNGTTIEGTKKTSPSGEVVTDTVETRKTGMVITTNIVEKKNGSTTTTKEVTKKDGSSSVTKTTKKKNGSSTVETFKTNSKGKITSYSNETVDKNGNKETITYSVKKQAKGKGKKATPGTVKIGKVSSEAEKVEIPEQVTIDGKKYVVNAISARAYANDESITEVHIGSNIKAIGAGVFEGASNLKNIYIDADHLKRIGDNAFAGIPEDATITIKAKDKAFDKVVSMLKASGLSSNVTIVKAE